MPSRPQHSTATGTPDHLDPDGVAGVGGPLPYTPHDQRPPHYQGVALPLDPMLAAAGAFWNERRELVRKWRIHNGPPKTVAGGRLVQEYWVRERHVAPPGMTLEDARAKGLDFYSPQWGWIRAGIKRETDDPMNLGTGHLVGEFETEDVTASDGGAVLAEPAALR